jgi:ketosteroid isomerase-like protein
MQVSQSIALLSLALATACGTAEPIPLTEAERQAIASSVDSATRAFEDAERDLDAGRVVAHIAPDFYMYNDGVRVGYEPTVQMIRQNFMTLQHMEPGFANIEIRVLGRDAALATFTFRDSIVDGTGASFSFRGPTSLIWERRGTDWLITYADADHYPVAVP